MKTRNMVLCAVFAALTAICAQVVIPLGGVPVSMATLSVMLCGAVLPSGTAAAAIGVYVLLGLAGTPVFAGMGAGPSVLLGVTGGYLLGYIPCAWLCAKLGRGHGWARLFASMLCGAAVCCICGGVWLMAVHGFTLKQALLAGIVPFVPGEILKSVGASCLARRIRKSLRT